MSFTGGRIAALLAEANGDQLVPGVRAGRLWRRLAPSAVAIVGASSIDRVLDVKDENNGVRSEQPFIFTEVSAFAEAGVDSSELGRTSA